MASGKAMDAEVNASGLRVGWAGQSSKQSLFDWTGPVFG